MLASAGPWALLAHVYWPLALHVYAATEAAHSPSAQEQPMPRGCFARRWRDT